MLMAASICNARYGDDPAIHALARQQRQVWVHPAGLALAASADTLATDALPFWPSVELNQGPRGDKVRRASCVRERPKATSARSA